VVLLAKSALGAADQAAARSLVGSALGADALPAAGVELRAADYGFAQLKRWHDELSPRVLALPGVVLTDIDERQNRLVIGVERAELSAQIEAELRQLGVPQAAARIVESEPVHQLVTLRDFLRPLRGGQQIAFGNFLCTLGFPAIRGNVPGFVTNSHCTNVQGGVEATQYFQPLIAAANHVGVELADPVYFVGGVCPPGRRCRRSDSAFVRKDAAVATAQGIIAQTPLASINITGIYRIRNEGAPLVGLPLNKEGRTTGRTQGAVASTCVNYNVAGSTITQLCQARVNAPVGPGDSGAPVFRILNANNDVQLQGILWGGPSTGAYYIFSPIGSVQLPTELGPLTDCLAGIGC
jgi:hypothetical protein